MLLVKEHCFLAAPGAERSPVRLSGQSFVEGRGQLNGFEQSLEVLPLVVCPG